MNNKIFITVLTEGEAMQFFLRDLNEYVVAAWEYFFHDEPCFNIKQDDIFNVDFNAIVSPANSFGLMSGGIDYIYTKKYGNQLQERLQKEIKRHFNSKKGMPVGHAITLPLEEDADKYLISAPTMENPGTDISRTNNVLLAFRAVLAQAKMFNKGVRIACPGLGTFSGRTDPYVSAYQMYRAWIDFKTK